MTPLLRLFTPICLSSRMFRLGPNHNCSVSYAMMAGSSAAYGHCTIFSRMTRIHLQWVVKHRTKGCNFGMRQWKWSFFLCVVHSEISVSGQHGSSQHGRFAFLRYIGNIPLSLDSVRYSPYGGRPHFGFDLRCFRILNA